MKLIVPLSINLLISFTGKSRSLSNRGFVNAGVPVQVFGESQRDSLSAYPSIYHALKKYITQPKRKSERFDPGLYGHRDQSEPSNYLAQSPGATVFISVSQVANMKKRVAFTGSRLVYA